MPEEALHLVQMFFDGRRLMRAVEHHELASKGADVGYLVHAELAACFGDRAPKPFRVREHGWRLEVLGYSNASAAELRKHAEAFAEPVYWSACSDLDSKAMPNDWAAGRRVGFEVRVCPVVRLRAALEIPAKDPERGTVEIREGAEVDVFLRECWQGSDVEVDRAEVYGRWLAEATASATTVDQVSMTQFQLPHLTRRTQGSQRKRRTIQRPDAMLRGQMTIKEPGEFWSLLERGVGRHRSFGFGMLLLRPPD